MINSVAYFGVRRTVKATVQNTKFAFARARYIFDMYFIAQLKSHSERKAGRILFNKVKEYLSAQEHKGFIDAFMQELKRLVAEVKRGYHSELIISMFGNSKSQWYRLTDQKSLAEIEHLLRQGYVLCRKKGN